MDLIFSWSEIARMMHGRTAIFLKNQFNSRKRKLEKKKEDEESSVEDRSGSPGRYNGSVNGSEIKIPLKDLFGDSFHAESDAHRDLANLYSAKEFLAESPSLPELVGHYKKVERSSLDSSRMLNSPPLSEIPVFPVKLPEEVERNPYYSNDVSQVKAGSIPRMDLTMFIPEEYREHHTKSDTKTLREMKKDSPPGCSKRGRFEDEDFPKVKKRKINDDGLINLLHAADHLNQ